MIFPWVQFSLIWSLKGLSKYFCEFSHQDTRVLRKAAMKIKYVRVSQEDQSWRKERGSHAEPCRETELGGEEEGLQVSQVVFVEGRGFKSPQSRKSIESTMEEEPAQQRECVPSGACSTLLLVLLLPLLAPTLLLLSCLLFVLLLFTLFSSSPLHPTLLPPFASVISSRCSSTSPFPPLLPFLV